MFSKLPQIVCASAMTITCLFSLPTMAQEVSASHLNAARKAMVATKATDSFDSILLSASARLKNDLTRVNPDQADNISTVVDAEAIALAPRRGDLEGEAARLFANSFSEEELAELSVFFSSPAGAKYLAATPVLARELGKAARIWANGVSRDLAVNVTKKLAKPVN